MRGPICNVGRSLTLTLQNLEFSNFHDNAELQYIVILYCYLIAKSANNVKFGASILTKAFPYLKHK